MNNGNGQKGAKPAALSSQQGRPMGPMGRGGMVLGVQKARDFKGTMRKLLEYLGSYRLAILIALIFAIASTIFSVIGPKILGLATTKLFDGVKGQLTGSSTGIDFDYIGKIILLLLGLYVL